MSRCSTMISVRSLREPWWAVFVGILLLVIIYVTVGLFYEILVRAPFFILAMIFTYEMLKRMGFPRERFYQQILALSIALSFAYVTPFLILLLLLIGSVIISYVLRTRRPTFRYLRMRCPRCGEGVSSGVRYRSNCGYNLRAPLTYPRRTPTRRPTTPSRRPYDTRRRTSPTSPPTSRSRICPACNRNPLRPGQDVCDECGRKLMGR